MTSKKEQFEILSMELLGRLNDVNRQSELFFPFDYKLAPDIEEEYFPKGAKLRASLIRSMVVIDNSFKKFQIFPSKDIMITYVETQKDILNSWKTEALEEFLETRKGIKNEEIDKFKKTINSIEKDINAASVAAIKEVGSSEEAKTLDEEYNDKPHGSFSDFIHNTILGLFK